MAVKILAGIVLYNPEIERLKENIDGICEQVDGIVLIDNGSENLNIVLNNICDYKNIEIIKNAENLGIAAALRKIMDYAIKKEYDWVITLDQDSVCEKGLIMAYSEYFEMESVGMLTCNIIDRNISIERGFEDNQKYREVKMCITSAACMNVKTYQNCDGFDDKMFIDGVDFDICFNLKKYGYKIIKINYDGILHEIGRGKDIKILGKCFRIYNHSPWRNYYMTRNAIYLLKKYPDELSVFEFIKKEIITEILILVYEKMSIRKLINRWKGIIAGIKLQKEVIKK